MCTCIVEAPLNRPEWGATLLRLLRSLPNGSERVRRAASLMRTCHLCDQPHFADAAGGWLSFLQPACLTFCCTVRTHGATCVVQLKIDALSVPARRA